MTKKTSRKTIVKEKILSSSPEKIKKIIDVATEAAVKRNKKWQDKVSQMDLKELEEEICKDVEFKKVGEIRAERVEEAKLITTPSLPQGRPSIRTIEIENEIFERLSKGESLNKICKDEHLPHASTIYDWLAIDEKFAENYARARDSYADHVVEEIMEISDDGRNDWMEKNDPDNPGYVFNGEHAQRSKIRIDTRKWIASKLKPKKYGDSLNIKGEIETKPSATSINQFSPDDILTGFKHGLPILDVEALEKVSEMVESELQKKRAGEARIINQN